MFNAVKNPNAVTNFTMLLITKLAPRSQIYFCKWDKEEDNSRTIIKAMYFCFIVLLIIAQTRVYTNTDHFLSKFFVAVYIL